MHVSATVIIVDEHTAENQSQVLPMASLADACASENMDVPRTCGRLWTGERVLGLTYYTRGFSHPEQLDAVLAYRHILKRGDVLLHQIISEMCRKSTKCQVVPRAARLLNVRHGLSMIRTSKRPSRLAFACNISHFLFFCSNMARGSIGSGILNFIW